MPFTVNEPGHVAEHNRIAQALPPGFVPASTDSPALTGTPTAPTPAVGDSSGSIATTEFVKGAALSLNVKWFGATGDGVTDDTDAFNAAIAAANAVGGSDREGVKGTTILVPAGRYVISSSLNPITVSAVSFVGVSREASVLLLSAPGNTFTWGDASMVNLAVGGGLRSLKIEYSADTSGSVVTIDYGFDMEFCDLQLVRIPTLLVLGATSARIAGGVTVRGVRGSIANIGVPLFILKWGSGLVVSDTQVFVRGVNAPVDPADQTTTLGAYVISMLQSGGSWDTVKMSNCMFEKFDMGIIAIATGGATWIDVFFDNTVFDYCKRQAIYLDSTGGTISTFRTSSTCWFMSWETNTVEILGTGYSEFHDIRGTFPISGIAALNYSLTSAKNCVFQMSVVATSRKSAALAALVFAAASTGFTVQGCRGGDDNSAGGAPWRSGYGLYIGADADDYVVTGNALSGTAGGFNIAANAAGSTSRIVRGNVGADYAGNSAITLPASGTAWMNTTPFDVELSLYGGTVTVIAKNGTTITGMTAGTIALAPGESVTVTYSSAPSATLFVHP